MAVPPFASVGAMSMDRQFVGAARVWMCAMGLMMGCPAQSSGPGGPGNDAGQVTPENDTGPATSDTGAPFPVDSGSMTNPEAGPDPLLDAGCDTTVPVEVEVIGDPPDMMLIVDASGSMITPLDLFNPLVSKWQVMSDALKGLVTTHNRRINFGLMTYPGTGECGTGIVRADIAPMNAMTIHSMLDAHGPGLNGATPTAPAVDATREYYMARTPNPIGRYAVLATDGLPNCGPRDMEGNYTGTSDETVTAIQALAAAGIPVYVIGFGSFLAADTTTLMRMANRRGDRHVLSGVPRLSRWPWRSRALRRRWCSPLAILHLPVRSGTRCSSAWISTAHWYRATRRVRVAGTTNRRRM